jgi:hypothetical protein
MVLLLMVVPMLLLVRVVVLVPEVAFAVACVVPAPVEAGRLCAGKGTQADGDTQCDAGDFQ